ncbi:unnamed protein product [Closterium sp. NIES-65]|nr:unnamed protein product [Closterium sp. NIES-65]
MLPMYTPSPPPTAVAAAAGGLTASHPNSVVAAGAADGAAAGAADGAAAAAAADGAAAAAAADGAAAAAAASSPSSSSYISESPCATNPSGPAAAAAAVAGLDSAADVSVHGSFLYALTQGSQQENPMPSYGADTQGVRRLNPMERSLNDLFSAVGTGAAAGGGKVEFLSSRIKGEVLSPSAAAAAAGAAAGAAAAAGTAGVTRAGEVKHGLVQWPGGQGGNAALGDLKQQHSQVSALGQVGQFEGQSKGRFEGQSSLGQAQGQFQGLSQGQAKDGDHQVGEKVETGAINEEMGGAAGIGSGGGSEAAGGSGAIDGVLRRSLRSPSERLNEMQLDELSQYFRMSIQNAARVLGVGLTVLKKRCRELGIQRWPHRKLKSLDNLIENMKEIHGPMAAETVEQLEAKKELLGKDPKQGLDPRIKTLRQVCFKASYKRRKAHTGSSLKALQGEMLAGEMKERGGGVGGGGVGGGDGVQSGGKGEMGGMVEGGGECGMEM